jgi:hypothetical protein
METYDSVRIKKSLDASIDLARKNGQFVPVIFCAMAFRIRHHINTQAFRVPVIIIDGERKVDKNQRIELLDD